MGELHALRRLIFGEWKYQRTHGFGVYLFSEYLYVLSVFRLSHAAVDLREIMQYSVSGCTCIVLWRQREAPSRIIFEPRSHYEICFSPSWISYIFDNFIYLFLRRFCFTYS